MKKIGITYNGKRKPEAKEASLKIASWLRKNNKVYVNPNKNVLKKGLDFVVAIGGDGSVLHTANRVAEFSIPIVGINFGRKGYLCGIEKSEVYEKLEKMLCEEFQVEERTRIQAEVFNGSRKVCTIDGLNEVLVGGINRTVFLEIEVISKEKSFKAKVTGDGIIFSTKTGSTAYNINAGGPVVLTDVFSVVANNALFESDFLAPNTKSFVISTDAIFRARILNSNKQNLPFLVADGQRDQRLKENELVIIEKSPRETLFVKI